MVLVTAWPDSHRMTEREAQDAIPAMRFSDGQPLFPGMVGQITPG
jgi:hypothetical protein